MGKSTKDQRDHFYRRGKQEGYRARSAYKLIQLDDQYGVLGCEADAPARAAGDSRAALAAAFGPALGADVYARLQGANRHPGAVVDLCAAPGSWSQVLSRTLSQSGTRIVAVDLQAMAPLAGVTQIVGDITTETTARAVERALADDGDDPAARRHADLVVCDGAPDVTGVPLLDEYVQSQLLMAAVELAMRMLRRDGVFIAKVFAQPGSASARVLLAQLRRQFAHVELAKPPSSRAASAEHFVVCLGFLDAAHATRRVHAEFLGDLRGYQAAGGAPMLGAAAASQT
ncbi:tRNA (cytidine(32)/guanosine(34)-2'-O)-methyltransferase [Malassezia sp. CBS 17886]|nr:tRNA (cytidine(32)/guanosine(34)-2'-O)-methyltransferase [Malassezia sp. CBS 17886]